MALHDTHVRRLLAFGVSGLSVVSDSLSAIKYARVTPVRDDRGIVVDFKARRPPGGLGRGEGGGWPWVGARCVRSVYGSRLVRSPPPPPARPPITT